MTRLYNRKRFTVIRRALRNQSHDIVCEKLFWYKVRRNQLGYKFRRQYGFGMYVVDFYCPELKLAVEIDGSTHITPAEIEADRARQEFIEGAGVKFKRYSNYDVKNNLSGVIDDLRDFCQILGG